MAPHPLCSSWFTSSLSPPFPHLPQTTRVLGPSIHTFSHSTVISYSNLLNISPHLNTLVLVHLCSQALPSSCVHACLVIQSDSLQPYRLQPARFFCPWDFPGKNTGVGCHVLLQGIFPTQGLNIRQLMFSFPFLLSHSFFIRKLQVECVDRLYAYQEVK